MRWLDKKGAAPEQITVIMDASSAATSGTATDVTSNFQFPKDTQ
jgi:hypothetical protein